MEDIAVYPCTVTHVITTEERNEIKTALTLLNHHIAPSREGYISRTSSNLLALKVKLNDLRNNLDITRIRSRPRKIMPVLNVTRTNMIY